MYLYNLIIFPLVEIIEISFAIIDRIFRSKALAIIGVSAAVTICTTPLYYIAEKWQQTERDLQNKFRPTINRIKSVFKGDEQYMILSAYYRQNHYHPVYSLRSSLGLLIQIPFFIAAYTYLSSLDYIKGTSFLLIKDFAEPDKLFSLNGFTINILPILMTLINCVSGIVYTKGKLLREKIQIYGMALVFLVLLYNSPSGLVLYWTMNNIFSLVKNILERMKQRKKIIYVFLCLLVLVVDFYFLRMGLSPKRLFVVLLCSALLFIPLYIKGFVLIKNLILKKINLEQSTLSDKSTFILSVLILCILSGLVIPGSLVASSVQEFSFLDSYTNPWPFIINVFIQSAGLFLFWPICVYFLFSKKIKYTLSFILSVICISALINTFIFPGDYGFISTTFKFSNPDTFESKYAIIILSGIATLFLLILFSFLLLTKHKILFRSFQVITLLALILNVIINARTINTDFREYERIRAASGMNSGEFANQEKIYNFSKNGKNIIVFMLDAAVSLYVPYIFKEKPELHKDFSGFTYYPNCVSFGTHTRIGAPALFGGHEYEPRLIQSDRLFTKEKHNEALLMLPRIFLDKGYSVTVTDPAFANYSLRPDLSIFEPWPEINVNNITGKYTGSWLRSHKDIEIVSIPHLLKSLLIRFSYLKISPPIFRIFIYDLANWLKPGGNISDSEFSFDTLDCYTTLDYFPQITGISEGDGDTYTSIVNDIVHYPAFYSYPDFTPASNLKKSNGPFANDESFQSNTAALLLVGKWLRFLKEQGVYDNTRIIIASDHGRTAYNTIPENISLPNGSRLSYYNSLLLVKDFNTEGKLKTDPAFMTQAAVPAIAVKDLIEGAKNPFSGNPIISKKEESALVATSNHLQFKIDDNQWLSVSGNVFDPVNWKQVENNH